MLIVNQSYLFLPQSYKYFTDYLNSRFLFPLENNFSIILIKIIISIFIKYYLSVKVDFQLQYNMIAIIIINQLSIYSIFILLTIPVSESLVELTKSNFSISKCLIKSKISVLILGTTNKKMRKNKIQLFFLIKKISQSSLINLLSIYSLFYINSNYEKYLLLLF